MSDGLMGGLGTLIVAGAVLGAMNRNNRGTTRTRTITRTKYITKNKKNTLKKPKTTTTIKTTRSAPKNWLM
jgi:hypothetical protein